MLKVTVLGCGASGGVPMIGCNCPICTSSDTRNKRMRASLYLENKDTRILIDTSPDLREQCLRFGVTDIDAILYTHAHADHLHGIDDVRPFNYRLNRGLGIYADRETLHTIESRFSYTLLPPKPVKDAWFRPCLIPHEIVPSHAFTLGSITILPFTQQHGKGTSLGFRIGNFAYSTDTNGLSEEAFSLLEGLDVWIVDCLRYDIAPTHAHLSMTLGWIERAKPKQAFLTHLNHQMDYATLCSELPSHVQPAHDGLVITIR